MNPPAVFTIGTDLGKRWIEVEYYDELMRKRMRKFFSIRRSDGEKAGLHGSITPVNIFRVVPNRRLRAGPQVLPERADFPDSKQPYRFRDVTDIVRYE